MPASIKKKYAFLFGLTGLLIASIHACGPGSPSTAQDFRTVSTAQSQTKDFSTIKTYALSDTVQAIEDPNDSGANSQVSSSFNDQIIAEVKKNLDALGWTRLTNTSGPKPDVVVQVSSMATTHTDVYYSSWYPYWGGYYGSWYGAAYSVGWSPTTVPVVVNSNVGSLIINMTDPNNPNTAEKKIPSLWAGVVNGLLAPAVSQSDTQALAISGIDQAFNQSPYLKGSQ